jgi:hypothetical protein
MMSHNGTLKYNLLHTHHFHSKGNPTICVNMTLCWGLVLRTCTMFVTPKTFTHMADMECNKSDR